MAKTISIAFGALSPPLCEQTGISSPDVDRCQILADSITRLRIAGLLTDGQCHAARKKLVKMVSAAVSTAMQEDENRRRAQ